jgi:glycosyltransferase involved in cell wall biosynthesis
MYKERRVAAVVPAYNEARHVADVIRRMPGCIDHIFVVDDCSSDGTAQAAEATGDARVRVLRNATQLGVGGATVAGWRAALAAGADIAVKIDGDGQMDPERVAALLDPLIEAGYAYAKGNRFVDTDALRQMPPVRLFGNFLLTFLTKLASGYWTIFDPQNGYAAITADALRALDLDHLARGFFFENDVLIHLNIRNQRVKDVALPAIYGSEASHLRIQRVLFTFPWYLLKRFWYRVYEKYVVRDFSPIGVFWFTGAPLLAWGVLFGLYTWGKSIVTGHVATTGTVMLSVLPFLVGFQLVLQAIILEIRESPR